MSPSQIYWFYAMDFKKAFDSGNDGETIKLSSFKFDFV